MSTHRIYPSNRPARPDAYSLNLPPAMQERIAKAAERNGRSVNAELAHVLQTQFPKETMAAKFINWLTTLPAGERGAVLAKARITCGESALSVYRSMANLTLGELNRKSGVPAATLLEIEKGRREITPTIAAKIAPALGIPPEELHE